MSTLAGTLRHNIHKYIHNARTWLGRTRTTPVCGVASWRSKVWNGRGSRHSGHSAGLWLLHIIGRLGQQRRDSIIDICHGAARIRGQESRWGRLVHTQAILLGHPESKGVVSGWQRRLIILAKKWGVLVVDWIEVVWSSLALAVCLCVCVCVCMCVHMLYIVGCIYVCVCMCVYLCVRACMCMSV